MGPPRLTPEHPSPPYAQTMPHQHQHQPQPQHHPQHHPPPPSKPGMSAMSRYNHNLKVLRKRDPSIISIFDQFSHVCLYHHTGNKWEKQGYEGTMFLYERNAYPPYGFYILNRVGMDDIIQRIYPEDIISESGSFTIIKSFPDFTARRMANLQYNTPGIIDKFDPGYAVPDMPELRTTERSTAIGLWNFPTNDREPLSPVMKRLHSYIKANLPYPDEFRYGPGKPPPPNPNPHPINGHNRSSSSSRHGESDAYDSQTSSYYQSDSSANDSPVISKNTASGAGAAALSELDKLFAKLGPTGITSISNESSNSFSSSASTSIATATSSAKTSTAPAPPVGLTSEMSVESLFAALGGSEMPSHPPPHQQQQQVKPSPPVPSTGISLLDTIFASASTTSPHAASSSEKHTPGYTSTDTQQQSSHSQSQQQQQILTPSVISNLLGLPLPPAQRNALLQPPTRTASAASTTYSVALSHPSSREGDNEDDSGGSLGGLETDNGDTGAPAVNGFLGVKPVSGKGRIKGDVTPRPLMDGKKALPPSSRVEHVSSTSTIRAGGTLSESRDTASTNTHINNNNIANQPQAPQNGRPLVPFEADSELWPYPRAPFDDGEGGEGEIVELDFADTSALSDMGTFHSRQHLNGSASGSGTPNGKVVNGKEKSKGKKKAGTRKERDEKEREAIERSWDVPSVSGAPAPPVRAVASSWQSYSPARVHTPPQPAPPHVQVNGGSAMTTPTIKVRPNPNAQSNGVLVNGKKPHPKVANAMQAQALNADTAKDSLIASLLPQHPTTIEKNEFVREVLTLIHTNKSFVDSLWQEYTSRVA